MQVYIRAEHTKQTVDAFSRNGRLMYTFVHDDNPLDNIAIQFSFAILIITKHKRYLDVIYTFDSFFNIYKSS